MEAEKEKEKEEIKFSEGFVGVKGVGRTQREGCFIWFNTEKNTKGERIYVPTIRAYHVEEIEKLFKGSPGVAIGVKREENKMQLIPVKKDWTRKIIREGDTIYIVIRRFLEKVEIDKFKPGEMVEILWEISDKSLVINLLENVRIRE